jgi:hypothetical protein
MSTAKTSHFFLRNHDGHRIGVVALRCEALPLETSDELGIRVAVSLCHDNDAWRSSTGVAAARGKLDAHNVKRQDNIAFFVAGHWNGPALDRIFANLKPSGYEKRHSDVDWPKMQALFERQWKYLTTTKPEIQQVT